MTPEEMGDEAMSSKKAAELISNWYQAYYSWQLGYMTSMASLPYATPHYAIYPTVSSGSRHPLLLSSASHAFSAGSAQQQAAGQARAERRAAAAPPSQTTTQPPPHPPQTVTYRVPSLIRRFMAECFDTVYIQVVKVFVALMLINAEWISVDSLRLFELIDELLSSSEESINSFRLPFDLLALEIAYVGFSILVECICLHTKGCTLGKWLFNMRVITCHSVHEVNNTNSGQLIQVSPGTPLTLKAIVLRTCMKSFSLIFLFPTILFFVIPIFAEYGQTSHDKLAQSIVVERVANTAA